MKHLLFVFFLAGCTEPAQHRLYVDVSSFPDEGRWAATSDAVDYVVVFYQAHGFDLERVRDPEDANIRTVFGPQDGYLGYYWNREDGIDIRIKVPLENSLSWWWPSDRTSVCFLGMPDLEGILLHEVGHAMGLVHVGAGDVMSQAQIADCVVVRELSQRRR